ncbi:hypothetical protein R7P67_22870 [Vibrio sp. Vb0937]|uniref:hypothetical protein n=1 Tax=unclassified Vibrio TaxID=2614977 RepID=UPI001EC58B43|nr:MULTISPECIES: hypothetical protein [unclassified Vibrio]EHZ2575553.1 hypothetical protein [Vibrio parahaemolyticus]MDW1827873.1 hypothetical protein [Vibrio sp. Vb0937]MDW3189070.1 hypothetical protein [Vibrio sp. Vb0932]
MRQILMSKRDEFDYHNDKDRSRSAAVKMLARVLRRKNRAMGLENDTEKVEIVYVSQSGKKKKLSSQ